MCCTGVAGPVIGLSIGTDGFKEVKHRRGEFLRGLTSFVVLYLSFAYSVLGNYFQKHILVARLNYFKK